MLRDGDRDLIERHSLFLAPSIRTLAFIRDREFDPERSTGGHAYDIITVGSGGGGTVAGGEKRVYPFTSIPVEPLIFVEREAREIASHFSRSLVLTGADASERSLKASPLGDAEVLHIASHCYIDDADVRRSFIVLDPERSFADSVSSAFEDGLLQWHEIAALELDESLVTLSACRSAGGVLAYGEGITGLTHAFITAGAECVLATQIDIPDRFAHLFMVTFYSRLLGGASAATALRGAQLEAAGWAETETSPALWASFVLVGDGNVTIGDR
jgi:CHAT domain-containing protein